jgi:hypothetical protein
MIPVARAATLCTGRPRPAGLRRRFARALDDYFTNRVRWTVSQAALRRSRIDVERCRRLLHKA